MKVARPDARWLEFLRESLLSRCTKVAGGSSDDDGSACSTSTSFASRYALAEVIGEGPFSTVRVAVDRTTGQQWACKIITCDTELQSGRKEAALLRQLAHPSLLQYREHFDEEGALYIVTELLRGPDLLTDVLDRQCYSEEWARVVMVQLLRGLSHIHSLGIIHRDVKLENIVLVEEEGSSAVRVIDFGFAEQSSIDCKQLISVECCGTPLYVAPELLYPDHSYGAGVDIWAAGVVLFALLSGSFPFFGVTLEELQCAVLDARLDFSAPVWDARSGGAKSLVKWMLTRDPDARPSADVLLRHPWLKENERAHPPSMPAVGLASYGGIGVSS